MNSPIGCHDEQKQTDMKLLLTNDDGIDAPGLAALIEALLPCGEVIVVAPLGAHSGCGHRVTTHGPVRVQQRGRNRFAIDGTPADCTRIGLTQLCPDAEWVVAGINAGGNLGWDVYPSGTVAAAREAAFLGKPALAVSHYHRKEWEFDWPLAAGWTTAIFQAILTKTTPAGTYWNANLPHLPSTAARPEIVFCPLDVHPLPVEYHDREGAFHYISRYHERRSAPDSDVDVCFSGRIAVTELRLRG